MKLKKIILILTVALMTLSCKKDDDGLVHFPFGSFKEVKEATLPDWLVGKWQSVNYAHVTEEFKKNIKRDKFLYISISEDRVIMVDIGLYNPSDSNDSFIYREAIKIAPNTIKYRVGLVRKNSKECGCNDFHTYKKVQ
ncbi:hypothetical protein ACF3OB_01315 [Capnocytophaga canis]|uniref:hypothetical protein n=1 Tax=Capnocytophaga canis TaxID=1848903 RepID=UPI00370D278B